MSGEVVKWVCGRLSVLLATEATEDIARYVLSMGNARDLEEYMNELLDQSDPRTKVFVDELLNRWRDSQCTNTSSKKYMSESREDTSIKKLNKQKKGQKSKVNVAQENTTSVNPSMNNIVSNGTSTANQSSSHESGTTSGSGGSGSKKKTTFLPLFSTEGQERTVAKLPGRHVCECQAMKHPLVNNCLKCGRIVCEQEGSGPCFFCKTLVCTRAEQEVLSRNSKKSNQLREQLTNIDSKLYGGGNGAERNGSSASAAAEEKAVAHKNKLLEYDRTSVKRTQVIDDESDYFATDGNQWLNKNEKQALGQRETELRDQRHVSRLDRRITLDFAGRRVVEDDTPVDVYNPNDAVVQAINFGVNDPNRTFNGDAQASYDPNDFNDDLVNPHIKQVPPKFISDDVTQAKKHVHTSHASLVKKSLRIQDAELQIMSDNGMALSMHQPWASLLVAGIKLHEGRSWYTPHRGVLWIAATSKQPSPDEIEIVERQYRPFIDSSVVFPRVYPTACLLGCVEVTNCLAHEDYIIQHPHGESDSPYVFICVNPRLLVVKFPIVGRHKIYKLDSDMHKAAKRGLHKGVTDCDSTKTGKQS